LPLTPGSSLGTYQIVGTLGIGGMGEVYRGLDSRLRRQVAIKVLPQALADDPERLQRFEREAQTLASLSHPNIVTIHSVEEADGRRFITMELVEGKALSELIPPGGLPLSRFFELTLQIVSAVSVAHDRSVAHRDLKPENVMVASDGRVRVLDFDLRRARLLMATRRCHASDYGHRPTDRHRALHVAGASQGAGLRRALGRLLPGRHPVRDGDRRAALPRGDLGRRDVGDPARPSALGDRDQGRPAARPRDAVATLSRESAGESLRIGARRRRGARGAQARDRRRRRSHLGARPSRCCRS
jgi:serine/threonine protein kinase